MDRPQALAIVEEFVKNLNLRKHMLAVEAAMRVYAVVYNGDPDEWGIAGLLHDFDWEIHPSLAEHPASGQSILEARGVPAGIRRAIMSHAPHTGVEPLTEMEKSLLAVDELSGFIVACALVQPQKTLAEVTPESVERKLRSKGFAANVSRPDIERGWQLLALQPTEHIRNVLTALQGIHDQLGL